MLYRGYKLIVLTGAILLASLGAQADYPEGLNTVQYWGQNSVGAAGGGSGGSQQALATYCDDATDALILSFLFEFGGSNQPNINLANTCHGTTFSGSTLLNCPDVGKDIKTCQAKGKKILLSLGGASGAYGFTSDAEGKQFAQTLWNLFGKGTSKTRPFGDAVVDGFDLDIEGGSSTGYAAMVTELRALFKKDTSKKYYITAAPQCPFPDAILGDVLNSVQFDAINVQFYNNYCSVNTYTGGNADSTTGFNFKTWDDWATTKSPNKDVKIYLAIPGSETAASTGYAPLNQIQEVIKGISSFKSFGGVTMWDASQSYNNKGGSPNFAAAVNKALKGDSNGSGSSKTTSAPVSGSSKSSSTSKGGDHQSTSVSSHSSHKHKPTHTSKSSHEISGTSITSQESSTTTSATQSGVATPTNSASSPGQPGTKCVSEGESCSQEGEYVCSGDSFGVCVYGKWSITPCSSGSTCLSTGTTVYCQTGKAEHECPTVSKRSLLMNNFASEFKNIRRSVDTKISMNKINGTSFDLTINARKLNPRPFKRNVVVQFTAPPHIKITQVENGKVSQVGRNVKLHIKNSQKKSMSLLFRVKGSVEKGILSVPNNESLSFTL